MTTGPKATLTESIQSTVFGRRLPKGQRVCELCQRRTRMPPKEHELRPECIANRTRLAYKARGWCVVTATYRPWLDAAGVPHEQGFAEVVLVEQGDENSRSGFKTVRKPGKRVYTFACAARVVEATGFTVQWRRALLDRVVKHGLEETNLLWGAADALRGNETSLSELATSIGYGAPPEYTAPRRHTP